VTFNFLAKRPQVCQNFYEALIFVTFDQAKVNINYKYMQALRCKTRLFLTTGDACSAFFFSENRGFFMESIL
jgi:hypothetical protein